MGLMLKYVSFILTIWLLTPQLYGQEVEQYATNNHPRFLIQTGLLNFLNNNVTLGAEYFINQKIGITVKGAYIFPFLWDYYKKGFFIKAGVSIRVPWLKTNATNATFVQPELIFSYNTDVDAMYYVRSDITAGAFINVSHHIYITKHLGFQPHIGLGFVDLWFRAVSWSHTPPFETVDKGWRHVTANQLKDFELINYYSHVGIIDYFALSVGLDFFWYL